MLPLHWQAGQISIVDDIEVTRHERHWDCTDVCMYVCRYHALTSMHVQCMHGDKTIGAIAWIVRILQLVSQSWSQPRFQLLLLVLAFIHWFICLSGSKLDAKSYSLTSLVYPSPAVCTPSEVVSQAGLCISIDRYGCQLYALLSLSSAQLSPARVSPAQRQPILFSSSIGINPPPPSNNR